MYRNLYPAVFGLLALLASGALARPAPRLAPAILELKVRPDASAFKDAGRNKPIVIRSEKEAAKYFSGKALADLQKEVSFEKQIVLVFAWRGSGQDRLSYAVAESFPEQITFTLTPGRTKDLRPHVHVYALRSNVKWSVRAG